jgi:hypothetical protein
VAAEEAFDQSQRGYRLSESFLLEAAATLGFYFILVFVLVAKFPDLPTRALLAARRTFALSSLRSQTQRISFVVLCCGVLVLTITLAFYLGSGHGHLLDYWFGGRGLASPIYRIWFWCGLFAAIGGLLGSFLYPRTLAPIVRWVKGEQSPGGRK